MLHTSGPARSQSMTITNFAGRAKVCVAFTSSYDLHARQNSFASVQQTTKQERARVECELRASVCSCLSTQQRRRHCSGPSKSPAPLPDATRGRGGPAAAWKPKTFQAETVRSAAIPAQCGQESLDCAWDQRLNSYVASHHQEAAASEGESRSRHLPRQPVGAVKG